MSNSKQEVLNQKYFTLGDEFSAPGGLDPVTSSTVVEGPIGTDFSLSSDQIKNVMNASQPENIILNLAEGSTITEAQGSVVSGLSAEYQGGAHPHVQEALSALKMGREEAIPGNVLVQEQVKAVEMMTPQPELVFVTGPLPGGFSVVEDEVSTKEKFQLRQRMRIEGVDPLWLNITIPGFDWHNDMFNIGCRMALIAEGFKRLKTNYTEDRVRRMDSNLLIEMAILSDSGRKEILRQALVLILLSGRSALLKAVEEKKDFGFVCGLADLIKNFRKGLEKKRGITGKIESKRPVFGEIEALVKKLEKEGGLDTSHTTLPFYRQLSRPS